MSINIKPLSHLINIIVSTRYHHPNFALFLGAGASNSSGVKSAMEMINEWRKMHCRMYKAATETNEEHLEKQYWYDKPEEYSTLFEKLFDEPSQRREYIESCIEGSNPSWGYIYLVNLIAHNVFNTIFTTNFDDLINEACYAFSSTTRPIVCAHDSSIRSIRITSKRPKIIKLHGDFLFDSIKNTLRELETLEQNMLDKFKQYSSEFGLIIAGYEGNDRSIIDALTLLLKFDQNYPHGVYWCVKKNTPINRNVEVLTRYPKFKLIEIEGFDELFAEINESMDLSLQPEMSDPYKALATKLDNLMKNNIKFSNEEMLHPIIKKHIDQLVDKIKSKSDISINNGTVQLEVGQSTFTLPIPFEFIANISERNNDLAKAAEFIEVPLKRNPNSSIYEQALRIFIKQKNTAKFNELIQNYLACEDIAKKEPEGSFNIAVLLMNDEKYDFADRVLDHAKNIVDKYNLKFQVNYYLINKLLIKKLKKEKLSPEEISTLNNITKSDDEYEKFGASILLEDYTTAETHLEDIKKKISTQRLKDISNWPIVKSFLIPHLRNQKIFDTQTEISKAVPKLSA
jgi:hypothetical protein